MAGYTAELRDGRKISIPGATRSTKDGSGTYFWDKDGQQIASFHDGIVDMAYPADAKVEAATLPAKPGT